MDFKPVRIRKRGRNYYLDYYRPNGERRRISTGSDRSVAQHMAVRFNNWLIEGKDPEREIERKKQAEIRQRTTLSEFFPEFMERHGKYQSEKMQNLYGYCFKNIMRCPELALIPLNEITRKLVLDYMHARKTQDGVSNATVNREVTVIKTMLNRAVEWEILPANPLNKLKLLPESPKRNVMLSLEEAAELINALPESFANVVEFAIYTGFRKENILGLKIEQVRFHDITRTADVMLKTKFGKFETFPVGELAVEVLRRAIGKRTEGYVFINPSTGTRYFSVSKSFRRAVLRLGLKVNDTPLRFHDLRHVFATWLHRQGASLDQLRFLLGHSKRSTTDRYTTASASDMRGVLSLMPRITKTSRRQA